MVIDLLLFPELTIQNNTGYGKHRFTGRKDRQNEFCLRVPALPEQG
jgi:ABC-type Fe3+/spermidine/putrescine transport system ATPase subunit